MGGGPAGQRRGLLVRARVPQAVQQAGHAARAVEGGAGGPAGQQRGGLLVRARVPQAVQQVGHAERVVEGDVGGGPAGQQRGLLVRARRPQAVQQADHAVRVVKVIEGGVGGGPAGQQRRPARARPPPAGRPAGGPRRAGRRGWRGRRDRGPAARRPARARPPPTGAPADRPRRPGRRGGRGRRPGWPAARRPARARPPPAGRPADWATSPGLSRVAWAAARLASSAACSCAPAYRRLSSRLATLPGSSRGAWAAARLASAAACSCAPVRHRLSSRRATPPGVVEGDVGGGPAGQRGGLLVRARVPQAVQQADHARPGRRGWRGRRDRGPAARRPARARPPPAGRSSSRATSSGSSRGTWAAAQCAGRGSAGRQAGGADEVEGGAGVTGCGGVLVQLGGVPVQAAVVGGVAERGLVAGRGVRGGRGPELRRGDLAGAVRPAMLVQVVREPVQRPRGGSHAGGLVPAAAGGAAGRAEADAGQRPVGALARDGGVGQGLFQPVLAERRPTGRRSGTPARRLPGRPAAGPLPCPGGGHPSRRRSAPPRRAGRCGTGPAAPAPRPGTGSPPRRARTGPPAPSATSAARPSWPICAGVNAAGTVMSCPASSSRAWACGSAPPAGRAVRPSQYSGHSVASTSTGARPGSRSSSRSPAATRSPSPASAGSR